MHDLKFCQPTHASGQGQRVINEVHVDIVQFRFYILNN